MESRHNFVADSKGNNFIQPVEGINKSAVIAYPIIASGDVTGCVIMLSNDSKGYPTETEIKLAQTAAAFLGKQIEE